MICFAAVQDSRENPLRALTNIMPNLIIECFIHIVLAVELILHLAITSPPLANCHAQSTLVVTGRVENSTGSVWYGRSCLFGIHRPGRTRIPSAGAEHLFRSSFSPPYRLNVCSFYSMSVQYGYGTLSSPLPLKDSNKCLIHLNEVKKSYLYMTCGTKFFFMNLWKCCMIRLK